MFLCDKKMFCVFCNNFFYKDLDPWNSMIGFVTVAVNDYLLTSWVFSTKYPFEKISTVLGPLIPELVSFGGGQTYGR